MLIESYQLQIDVSKHSSEVFEYEAIAHLPRDIRGVLPYMNAELRAAVYLPEIPAISWRRDEYKIGFWADKIAVENLAEREDAEREVRELVDLVNDIWERREQITPEHTTKEKLQPLAVYRLLPKTNCKKCGESSCFAFALKLAAGQRELKECGPLHADEQYAEKRAELEADVATKQTLL